ncbi:IS66 family transposase [Paraburkholderia strydomiana]|uniref:IS66 family transposase n=1 Tax=Paraburkholderia strydomiana TaxID=1245417 RepID=UPI0038B92579
MRARACSQTSWSTPKFRQWLEGNVIGLPAHAPLAKAFGYALRHWQALVRYTESGVLYPTTTL